MRQDIGPRMHLDTTQAVQLTYSSLTRSQNANPHSNISTFHTGQTIPRVNTRNAIVAATQAALAAVTGLHSTNSTLATGTVNPTIHPHFRSKPVCEISCVHCSSDICERGMRAVLLGDIKVELFSTDVAPTGVQLVFADYLTKSCR